MTTYYFRFALLPIILLTAVLLVIRSQPYDDHELRELLLPTGCPAPCFMGIRPGVTTLEEAVKLLEASGWVEGIDYEQYENNRGFILWNWNTHKPNWIRENLRGSIFVRDKVVKEITIYSEFLLGDTRLILGIPVMDVVMPPQDPREEHFQYEAYYTQYVIRSRQPCHVIEPLREAIEINIQDSTYYKSKHINFLNDLFRAC